MIKVRQGKLEDIGQLIVLCRQFCDEMNISFDMRTQIKTLKQAMKFGEVLCAEDRYEIIGAAGVFIINDWINNINNSRVVEFMWHSLPSLTEYKRAKVMVLLEQGMRKIALDKNLPLYISIRADGKSGNISDYLKSKGYSSYETVYVKE